MSIKQIILTFLFAGIAVGSSAQVRISQIESKDTARMVMVSDTVMEDATEYKQLKWKSIDSLVKQIALDSLGLDSALWKSDGGNALLQKGNENNLLIGSGAGTSITNGINNSLIGSSAGSSLTSGSYNSFLSFQAGYSNVTGNYNYFAGYQAGYTNTASHNTFLGFQSGYDNTIGTFNNFVGYQSGFNNTSGSFNTFFGYLAALGDAGGITGSYNNAIGREAGKSISSAGYNNFFGYQAGVNSLSGNFNNYFGYLAGGNNSSGSYNNMFGYLAGRGTASTSSFNNFFGREAGYDNTTGSYNNFFGYGAGQKNTTGGFNNAFGYLAGFNNTGGFYNNFIGRQTGYLNVSGSYNVFIGYQAGYNETASNRLYIDNSGSATPLIYGEFDNDLVKINDDLYVNSLNTADYVKSTADKLEAGTWSSVNLSEFNNDLAPSFDGLYTSLDFTGTTGLSDGIDNDTDTDEFGAMDFYSSGSTFFYRAEDDGGTLIGDPISFTGGTNITLAQSGNGIIINSSAAATQWVDLGTSLSSNNHDIVVNDIDFTEKGTTATSVTGQDANGWATDVNIGSGLTLSGGTLSASSSSPWTDNGSYVSTTNNENVYIANGEAILIGTTSESAYALDISSTTEMRLLGDLYDKNSSNGNNGDVLTSDGDQIVWAAPSVEVGLAQATYTTQQTTSSSLIKSQLSSSINANGCTVNTTSDYISCTTAGYYKINATFNLGAAVSTAGIVQAYIYTNGSSSSTQAYANLAANVSATRSLSTIQYLSSGEQVDVRFGAISGSNVRMLSLYLTVEYISN